MSTTTSSTFFCSYCGKSFHTTDNRVRFCSKRCLTLFGTKFNLPFPDDFQLSDELAKLQLLLQQSPVPDSSLSKEAILVFYDSVFIQLTKIVKWINAHAMEQEKATAMHEVTKLKNKFNSVLEKATELKVENRSLKQKIKSLENQDFNLAYTLLGVNETTNSEQLKKAFNDKIKQLHPDVFTGGEDLFKAIKLAYDLLQSSKK
jgi:regulator of replication initiation timing